MNKENKTCETIADISTKRMFRLILHIQEKILDEDITNKKEILSLLCSIEHDVLMINDKNNNITRDLYN